jgi:hypothetical protein
MPQTWKYIALAYICAAQVACKPSADGAPSSSVNRGAHEISPNQSNSCAQEAAHWFKQWYGAGTQPIPDGQVKVAYEPVVNARVGKCLILVRGTVTRTLVGSDRSISKWRSIVDVRANVEVGGYMEGYFYGPPERCVVAKEKCNSLAEWETMAKGL